MLDERLRPLPRNIGGHIKRKIKPRILRRIILRGVLFILLPVTIILGGLYIMVHKNAYEVYASDELAGIIRLTDEISLDIVINDLKKKLGDNGAEIKLVEEISLKPVSVGNNRISEYDEVMASLTEKIDYQIKAVAFVLDKTNLAVLKDEAEAETVRTNIFQQYISDGGEVQSMEFLEEVSLEEIFTEKSSIMTMGKAFEVLTEKKARVETYIVKEKDVLSSIASNYDMTLEALLNINKDLSVDSTLYIGQAINVERVLPIMSVKTVEK
ncbi:MAG: LysM domain-containing protein, partial [Clostridiales bacterium]|nr:LysM domain-containing protein [Clostridiales bacterium]